MRNFLSLKRTPFILAVAALMALAMSWATDAQAAKKVMCLKTNTGQYIELARVSMMAVADGASTFEIIVKDGQGATGVESISFEKYESDIDLSKYGDDTQQGDNIDMTKPVFLITSTGKYFYMKDMPTMTAQDGTSTFVVTVGGNVESNVASVYFYRGPADSVEEYISGIRAPQVAAEPLRLMTPVSSTLQLSGCGTASRAVVYAANGQQVAASSVANGVTTINVAGLIPGVYVVRVGNKALKFMKK